MFSVYGSVTSEIKELFSVWENDTQTQKFVGTHFYNVYESRGHLKDSVKFVRIRPGETKTLYIVAPIFDSVDEELSTNTGADINGVISFKMDVTNNNGALKGVIYGYFDRAEIVYGQYRNLSPDNSKVQSSQGLVDFSPAFNYEFRYTVAPNPIPTSGETLFEVPQTTIDHLFKPYTIND